MYNRRNGLPVAGTSADPGSGNTSIKEAIDNVDGQLAEIGVTVNDRDIDKLVKIIANTSSNFNTSRQVDFNSSCNSSVLNKSYSSDFNKVPSREVFNENDDQQQTTYEDENNVNIKSALQLPLAHDDTLPQSSARPSPNTSNPAAAPPFSGEREENVAVRGELFNNSSFSSSVSDVEDVKTLAASYPVIEGRLR